MYIEIVNSDKISDKNSDKDSDNESVKSKHTVDDIDSDDSDKEDNPDELKILFSKSNVEMLFCDIVTLL